VPGDRLRQRAAGGAAEHQTVAALPMPPLVGQRLQDV
jgi:hypothetical protein